MEGSKMTKRVIYECIADTSKTRDTDTAQFEHRPFTIVFCSPHTITSIASEIVQ
jgi:hypothetical protein